MIYKVYIDDSGLKEFIDPYDADNVESPDKYSEKTRDFWNRNYFVLTGIRVKQSNLAQINSDIMALKISCFGTHEVEIKSNWLRIPLEREKHYLTPYKLNDKQLNEFGEKYIDLIAANPKSIKIISVVVDKRYFKVRKPIEDDPLFRATQVILERINRMGDYNIVVFDQMESKKDLQIGKHEKMLKIYHNNDGMKKIYVKDYAQIVDFTITDSRNENFLQIADVCGYNIYRQFCEHGREWLGIGNKDRHKLPCYKYFTRIVCNMSCSPYLEHMNRIRGYGVSLIPDVAKNNWCLPGKCFRKKTPS